MGRLVRKDRVRPLRQGGKHVNIIRDTMDATWHPCDNRFYDSKAKFRAVTRAHGGTEIGNDKFPAHAPERDNSIKHDIARAIAELGG